MGDACLTCAGTGQWRAGVPCRDCRPVCVDVAFAGREPAADPAARPAPMVAERAIGPQAPDTAPDGAPAGAGATPESLAEVLRRAAERVEETTPDPGCLHLADAHVVGYRRCDRCSAALAQDATDAARLRALAEAVDGESRTSLLLALRRGVENATEWAAVARRYHQPDLAAQHDADAAHCEAFARLLSGAPATDAEG